MREIKFRGVPKVNDYFNVVGNAFKKSGEDKGFVYGSLITNEQNRCFIGLTAFVELNCVIANATMTVVEVLPETVCQYIGRRDKNKKPIFERDIVKLNDMIGVVVCDNDAFMLQSYNHSTNLYEHTYFCNVADSASLEVLGNALNPKKFYYDFEEKNEIKNKYSFL